MQLNTDTARLRAFIDACPDCEMIAEGEYIADLYDTERPLTLDLLFSKDKCEVLAAAFLLYDEEQDGWYMGDQVDDVNVILKALEDAINAAHGA